MKHLRPTLFVILLIFAAACGDSRKPTVTILSTTDVHGTFFSYDFVNLSETERSLASFSEYVNLLRNEGHRTVILDNGDILQGQPEVYYYNFIDTVAEHLCASILNYIGYDAATVGNHDIEAGHQVYGRLADDYNFPMLAANAVRIDNGEPWFEPYTIIRRGGLKIAVLGLITPSVPDWLPPVLYEGMEFQDMTETASRWMPVILEEKPDIVVGLFHSGWGSGSATPAPGNSSAAVAYNVPGFDIVFVGHDHSPMMSNFVNIEGDTVVIMNAGSRVSHVARVEVFREKGRDEKGRRRVRFEATLDEMSGVPSDKEFMEKFSSQYDDVAAFVDRVIGYAPQLIWSGASLFGPSPFVDMIHSVQLDLTGADISFAAPLSFNMTIDSGNVKVADMFKLYRFENMLYKLEMTGSEIDGFLESSYGRWFNRMKSSDDYLIEYRRDAAGEVQLVNGRPRVREQVYNFDSAMGISYVVDVTKERGNRVTISNLNDGTPFHNDSTYTVAINSYRASGGGGHIRNGAQLSPEEVEERLIYSTTKDLRYYMIKWIEENGRLEPQQNAEWKVIPERFAQEAKAREMQLLFGSN
jgi:2',3'-cyclic-nucleotide 2'-phosphodiesterase / 3'-nucleotidase